MTANNDAQETIPPEKIPMEGRSRRIGIILFVMLTCGILFMGLLNFGDAEPFPTGTSAQPKFSPVGQDKGQAVVAPCAAPEKIVVHQIRPVGIDRSKCEMLPSTGSATCATGEVGMRFGRTVIGSYRRVYCGGCEKLVYPAGKATTVDLTINQEGGSK